MRKILVVCLLLALVIGLCACASPEKKLAGTWVHEETVFGVPAKTIMRFNEDGTGMKTTVLSVEFTYAVEKDKLTITSYPLGIKTTEEFKFEFSQGNLVLWDKDGNAETYQKTEKQTTID